jgi:4-diphosphocytidyl-2-C-methyl-D-erythritol kinase
MILFSNAKINLGLNVLGKRPDGYHDLETVFYPIPVVDVLEIMPTNDGSEGVCKLHSSGLQVPGNSDENLCVKAYRLLHADFNLPSVVVYLHKVIPFGAGLGGGSSNASFMLKGLNELFGLRLEKKTLMEYAVKLGADCPFFIENTPCIATGIGEVLEPITLDLSKYSMILITPPIHVSTQEAFSNLNIHRRPTGLSEKIRKESVENWATFMVNDFQSGLASSNPAFQQLFELINEQQPIYYSLSGTGSSIFAIFERGSEHFQRALTGLTQRSEDLKYTLFNFDLK